MTNNNHTLVVLTPGFPADEEDSACLPSQQLLIKALNKAFPALRIILLSFQYPPVRSDYHWQGNRVISFGIEKGFYSRMLWRLVWKTLLQIRREQQILALLSFWCTECALIGTYAGYLYGIRHYCWICGQDAKKENRLVRFIRPRPSELIAMSDFLAKEFYKNHGIRPRRIIPNGVDTALFKDYPPVRDIDVLGAGSLTALKQYNLFLEVIRELSFRFPALKAMICGKGAAADALQAQIGDLHIGSHVTLAGEQPHPEIIRRMQRAKIFLHPSSYEGFSTACLEALYAGAHVISFCNPVTKKIKHWHVVRSKEEMAHLAAVLLKDPGLDHEPVMMHSMEDSARAMMTMFMNNE